MRKKRTPEERDRFWATKGCEKHRGSAAHFHAAYCVLCLDRLIEAAIQIERDRMDQEGGTPSEVK